MQILQFIRICPVAAWPILRLDVTNKVAIVRLDDIGSVIILGANPDSRCVATNQFVVLPWPRQCTRHPLAEGDSSASEADSD